MKLKIPISGGFTKQVEVEILKDDDKFILRSFYDADLVNEIKHFEKAKWNPDLKIWHFPVTSRNIYTLNYLVGNKVERLFQKPQANIISERPLREHQIEGIQFALTKKTCMLNFDMGLGKTLIGIEIIERSNQPYNWVLIAPFGAQQTWQRELKKWNASFSFIHITTSESVHKYLNIVESNRSLTPKGIIVDESIKCANPNAKRSQSVKKLCDIVRETDGYILLLSGAPAPKEPTQWWHQIECIQPGFIREPDAFKFKSRYAEIVWEDGEYGRYPKVAFWKEDEVEKLGKRLAPIVLRKKKEEVLDLPEKVFDILEAQPEEESERIARLIIDTTDSALDALNMLRQLSDGFLYETEICDDECTICKGTGKKGIYQCWKCKGVGKIYQKLRETKYADSPKLNILKELLNFYHTDNGGNGRLLIYAVYHASIDKIVDLIKEGGWDCEKIDGRGWSNPEILDIFDNESLSENFAVVAHPASVHGCNFQRTNCLIYFSNDFNPDTRTQSLERADRLTGRTVATRIVDIVNLPSDRLILDRVNKGLGIQELTMEEIRRYYASF